MTDKITKLGTTEKTAQHEIENIESQTITIRENDQSNVNESDNSGTENINTIPTVNKDTEQDTPHTKKTKIKSKIQINDSKRDISAYLRSEFSMSAKDDQRNKVAIHKLPHYEDVDDTEDRDTRKHMKSTYSNDTVTVQCQLFGSDKMPENKVLMVYEPEARNYTVKGMFFILMMIHLLILFFLIVIYFGFYITVRKNWLLYLIPPTLILVITLIVAMHVQKLREPEFGCLLLFIVFACVSVIIVSVSSYIETRDLVYMYTALAFTDLSCALLGCYKFDYSSKWLYAIALGSGFLFMAISVLAYMHVPYMFHTSQIVRYIGLDEKPVTYHLVYFILVLVIIALTVAELHLLLDGEWVQLAEDDYVYGAFLLSIAVFDFPIRMLRLLCIGKPSDDDDEEDED